MADFNVYIIDPFDKMPLVAVATMLTEWFDPIAKRAGYSRAYVCSPQYHVQPALDELLIYICPFSTSVVQKMPGAQKSNWPDPALGRHLGVTEMQSGVTGSEVWAKFSDADAFASLIFHEAMHNKLQLGAALHTRFKPSDRLSADEISWPTSPSTPESDGMAAALRNRVRQWADGQQLLRGAARRYRDGDPLWDADISA